MRGSKAPLQPNVDPEAAADEEQQGVRHEDDKRFERENFEENLLDAGLEMEKDEQVRNILWVWFLFLLFRVAGSYQVEHRMWYIETPSKYFILLG